MSFWIVVALVVVAGFGVAWWASGRAKNGPERGSAVSDGTQWARGQAARHSLHQPPPM